MTNRTRVLLRPICAMAISGIAQVAQAGSVTISDGWFRAIPGGAPAGGYFTLQNDSGKLVELTGAKSPACGTLMLHKTDTEGGMAKMSDVESVPVAVGAHVSFAPRGYHLMCTDPTSAVKPGNDVPVTLLFRDGMKVTAEFRVHTVTGN